MVDLEILVLDKDVARAQTSWSFGTVVEVEKWSERMVSIAENCDISGEVAKDM